MEDTQVTLSLSVSALRILPSHFPYILFPIPRDFISRALHGPSGSPGHGFLGQIVPVCYPVIKAKLTSVQQKSLELKDDKQKRNGI